MVVLFTRADATEGMQSSFGDESTRMAKRDLGDTCGLATEGCDGVCGGSIAFHGPLDSDFRRSDPST
jgi:hypothetical protein